LGNWAKGETRLSLSLFPRRELKGVQVGVLHPESQTRGLTGHAPDIAAFF